MNWRHFISRLLAIFVIAGLVVAPLVTPAAAYAMTAGDMTASAAVAAMTDDMSAMAADMPCCPDKSAPIGGNTCPPMAICMLQAFAALPASGVVTMSPVIIRALMPQSDPELDSLGYSPPPRPPRSLI